MVIRPKMSTPPVKSLPREIIFDILLRLPVKSLGRFRCVSKTWLSMITDPHFVNSHLHYTNTYKLILASHSLYSINHEATPIDEEIVSVELDFPLKSNSGRPHVKIFGSCNGLICIMPISEVFFLFNPSTRESRRIPDFQVTPLIDRDLYGFGYSQIIDDYKFVKVVSGSIVCVFSLRTGSWKRVQDCHYVYPYSVRGTPLNGAIHWVLNRPGGACVLAAFDLVEESFKDLPLPDAFRGFTSLSTGVLEGCLCVSHYYSNITSREFWVMKEYGVKKSWTKVLIQEPYHVLKPLCYWKNCKMLLAIDEHQLVLCNRKDGTCKDFMVVDIPGQFDVDTYVESLVPLNYNNRT